MEPTKPVRMLQNFSGKIVLEVAGGCGAIWGFADATTLRVPETQESWRSASKLIATILLFRLLMQTSDFWMGVKYDEKSISRLIQIFAPKLVLEVFGATGAIWGFAEVLTLRNDETQEFWRGAAIAVGVVFFGRYLLQMCDFVDQINANAPSIAKMDRRSRFVHIFSAKLVLEVFGGGGAIWGCSEALTFRNDDTQEFWRFWSLVSACIFGIRVVLEMHDFLSGGRIEKIEVPSPRNALEFQETAYESPTGSSIEPNVGRELETQTEALMGRTHSPDVEKNIPVFRSPMKLEDHLPVFNSPMKPYTLQYHRSYEREEDPLEGSQSPSYGSSDHDSCDGELLPSFASPTKLGYGSFDEEETDFATENAPMIRDASTTLDLKLHVPALG